MLYPSFSCVDRPLAGARTARRVPHSAGAGTGAGGCGTVRLRQAQREAAVACGASLSTIRCRGEAGELSGAVSDEICGWLIPVDVLLPAGFLAEDSRRSEVSPGRYRQAPPGGRGRRGGAAR